MTILRYAARTLAVITALLAAVVGFLMWAVVVWKRMLRAERKARS